jgi:hypothetical protein
MRRAIVLLAGIVLHAGPALAQPDGRMAPGSGSGSAPGTGATNPGYEAQQEPKSSGAIKRDPEEKERGSIGAGHVEPGGSGARTTATTVPSRP